MYSRSKTIDITNYALLLSLEREINSFRGADRFEPGYCCNPYHHMIARGQQTSVWSVDRIVTQTVSLIISNSLTLWSLSRSLIFNLTSLPPSMNWQSAAEYNLVGLFSRQAMSSFFQLTEGKNRGICQISLNSEIFVVLITHPSF